MAMEINSNLTSQIMDIKSPAQGVTRKNDKATNNVEEYYEKLCKKFPQISFNTGGTCTANKVVVNISPECLKKMANDPEFAKEVEWNLSGEVAANAQIHSWARRDGIEVYGRTVTYDANGKRESGYGMRTANPSNGNNGILGSQKSKKREQEEHLEEIREKQREREEYLSELSGSNGVAVKAYTQAEFDYASLLSTLDAKI